MALKSHEQEQTTVYTLGPLIHNNDVINRLESEGISAISREQISDLQADDVVVIRSHGIDPDTIVQIKNTSAQMVDATCPFVSTIQRKASRYYKQGYTVVIVGDREHPEVKGINGWCDNQAIVTRDGSDLPSLLDKVCVVAQTTEKQENYDQVVAVVTDRAMKVTAFNTICSATRERQSSTATLSKEVDLMIVIGGRHSSNTKKLYDISLNNCANTVFIENDTELDEACYIDPSITKVGITAGASTPNEVVKAVINKIQRAGIEV